MITYDIAGLLMLKLYHDRRATVTLAGVGRESARYLRENEWMWISPFNYSALPKHLQLRLAQMSIDACDGGPEHKKLRCINWTLNRVHLFDYWTKDWYRYKGWLTDSSDDPDSPFSRESSDRSNYSYESYQWSPVSHSGTSSSGSDDEDLLAAYYAERAEGITRAE
jgi:hypothetical protein